MRELTLQRQSDGLVYTFRAAGMRNGRPLYRRTDARGLVLYWHPDHGWSSWSEDGADLTGQLWQADADDLRSDLPPEGAWVSRKGAKSYVYDLRHG